MRKRISIAFLLAVLTASLAVAAVPSVVNYQGRLTDNSPQQNPLDATVTMDFSIWDAASGGSSLWAETQSVQVVRGLFNVLLGSLNAMPPTLFTSGDVRYLEIHVSGETLTPRQRIATAPFANTAGRADDASSLGGVGASAYQQRINTPCPAGYAINAVAADGTATCIQGPQGPPGPPGSGLETGNIAGTVTRCDTGPVAGVLIYVPGRSATVYSGPDGSYELSYLPAGTYTVQYKTPGTAGASTASGVVVSSGQTTSRGATSVADLNTDLLNCGSCGRACSSNHISATCNAGTCGGTCSSPFANCNADSSDGCETDLSSPSLCGSCTPCSTNHIAPTCAGGNTCTGICETGWTNCDSNMRTNGCETDVTTTSNCGWCHNVCAAGQACVNGQCV